MADFDELAHYGTPRHSGRYPWGSGDNPMQRGNRDFLGYVAQLQAQGLSEKQIVEGLGLNSVTELRNKKSVARAQVRREDVAQVLRLQAKNVSNVEIGRRMGIGESQVRALANPALMEKRNVLENTANRLKSEIADGGYLDIGYGTENWISISKTKLSAAVSMLKEEGYRVYDIPQPQQFGQGNTTVHVLAPPGTSWADVARNRSQIKTLAAYTENQGKTFTDIKPPVSINSKRIAVLHAGEGGEKADGMIYLRPGVPDISLGSSRYAQVRIKVDEDHYLKGMAMYKKDMPEGADLLFCTSKQNTGNKLDAMKPTGEDTLNPFGAKIIRQKKYIDAQGHERQSPINIVNEEGNWATWRPSLSSQILSKQPTQLAKKQLDEALTSHIKNLDEIRELTNPVVKKKLLEMYADQADADAVHLKAAALPRQGTYVLLPIHSLKQNEIYAPNFNNGDRVALIRHPHAGIFEIPELKVNNRNREGKEALGPRGTRLEAAIDAVGIHPNVAKRLSGADFDGDAVIVVPNNRRTLRTGAPIKELTEFDPRQFYPPKDGMSTIDGGVYHAATKRVEYGEKGPNGRPKQLHMGEVSNLITDMTIKNASTDEIVRAVRHSMVVIDSEKHALDYKKSYTDNGIAELKRKYQGVSSSGRIKGASTLISRAKSQQLVDQRRPQRAKAGGPIDPKTGRKIYVPTGRTHINKQGQRVKRQIKSTKLAETDDARTLSSGSRMEEIYAAHSNSLKALANQARLESLSTGKLTRSPTAAVVYKQQVASLNAKLNMAQKARPLERQAQLIAAVAIAAKKQANPSLKTDPAALRKVRFKELDRARERLNSKKPVIDITDDEWEAIQAGAISTHKLNQIMENANLDKLKKLATPRAATVMTPQMLVRVRAKLQSGATQAEVARELGIPVSTINSALLSEGGG